MPNAKKEFTLHDSFGYWIIRLCRAMQSNLTRQLAAFDLNSRLLAILMSVEEVDMRTPSAIADHLLVDRAIVARALKDLRARNLVDFDRNDKDGRSRTVFLTQEGKAIMELGRECMRLCDDAYKDKLPDGLTDAIRQLFHAGDTP